MAHGLHRTLKPPAAALGNAGLQKGSSFLIEAVEILGKVAKRLGQRSRINRHHRQRFKLQKFAELRFNVLLADHQIFNAD